MPHSDVEARKAELLSAGLRGPFRVTQDPTSVSVNVFYLCLTTSEIKTRRGCLATSLNGLHGSGPRSTPLPVQPSAKVHSGKRHGCLSKWGPATHVGDSDGVPSSWLCPGPVLAVVAIWGVN